MSLHPVTGHEVIRDGLVRAHQRESLPFPLLIHGPPGVGKQRTALWIAQLLLCGHPVPEGPCGECKDCRLALALEHPDLHWYFPLPRPRGVSGADRLADALEDARTAALEEIRSDPLSLTYSDEPTGLYMATAQALRKKAHRRPSMNDLQVFLVAEAETLVPQESSPEAANALLKLLEEPPEGTRMILTSNEPGRLLPTIRSRTVPLHLAALERERVEAFLVEQAEADPEEASRAARLSGGSIGRALGFLPDGDEPGPLEELRRRAFHLVRAALEGGPGGGFAQALEFPPARARGLLDLFLFVEEWLRDLAAVAVGAEGELVNTDAAAHLGRIVERRRVSPLAVAKAIGAVEEARFLASGNVNPQLIVGGLLRSLRRELVSASPTPTKGGTG